MNIRAGFVLHLVGLARWDPNPLSVSEGHGLAIDLDQGLSRKYVEELLRAIMEVPNLSRARRHAFLNHAEFGIFQQVPAVTLGSPRVVLGGFFADRNHLLCPRAEGYAFVVGGFNPSSFITICKSFHASTFCLGSRSKNAGWYVTANLQPVQFESLLRVSLRNPAGLKS